MNGVEEREKEKRKGGCDGLAAEGEETEAEDEGGSSLLSLRLSLSETKPQRLRLPLIPSAAQQKNIHRLQRILSHLPPFPEPREGEGTTNDSYSNARDDDRRLVAFPPLPSPRFWFETGTPGKARLTTMAKRPHAGQRSSF
jgi:hypothetical protein